MNKFSLTQLKYVLSIDQHRHFGQAAAFCNVSQPTLSMQVQKLEDDLGVVLFDRSRKPILPTEKGMAFIEQARKVIEQAEHLEYVCLHGEKEKTGILKIGIIPTAFTTIVPFILRPFHNVYKNIELIFEELQTPVIIERLKYGTLDGAILAQQLPDLQSPQFEIGHEPFYVYCSSEDKLLNNPEVSVDDLKDVVPLWMMKEGHCLRDQVIEQLQWNEFDCVSRYESGNYDTLIRLVDHYGGRTILPSLVLNYLSPDQLLRVRKFNNSALGRKLYLIYGRPFQKESLLNSLENCLLETIGPKFSIGPSLPLKQAIIHSEVSSS